MRENGTKLELLTLKNNYFIIMKFMPFFIIQFYCDFISIFFFFFLFV